MLCRRYIKKDQFINLTFIENPDCIEGVTDICRIFESDSLDKPFILKEQAGDYADLKNIDSLLDEIFQYFHTVLMTPFRVELDPDNIFFGYG